MTKKPFKIYLAFSRDFSLYIAELWNSLAQRDLKRAYGAGFTDQIVRYDGRKSDCFRLQHEIQRVERKIVSRPLTSQLFAFDSHKQFRNRVEQLETRLCAKPDRRGNQAFAALGQARRAFAALYPPFMLATFLPGPWADEFKKKHGQLAQPVLREFFDDRACSEGILERLDVMARCYIALELAKRNLPASLAPFVRQIEYQAMVAGKKAPGRSILEARRSGYVLTGSKIVVGQPFENVIKALGYSYTPLKFDTNQSEIKGQAVKRLGKVRGKVKIVLNNLEAKNFSAGWVLVAPMTTPDYLPAMKRARAVVTDEGGITSHAAIACRELNIPAVIGTKVATKVFKDGDWVEMDTMRGVIRKVV